MVYLQITNLMICFKSLQYLGSGAQANARPYDLNMRYTHRDSLNPINIHYSFVILVPTFSPIAAR